MYNFGQIDPNSEMRINDKFGVLKMSLKDGSYDWEFWSINKTIEDRGSGKCLNSR